MIIEKKQLSPTNTILYFPTPLPIIGTYIQKDLEKPDLLKELDTQELSSSYLLTKDFIYLYSNNKENLEDLISLSISLLDELSISSPSIVAPQENLEEKIKLILKLVVAPFLNKDGGDIEFNSYQNDTVYVKFLGKCHSCPYAQKTLKEKVEKNLITYLPTITKAELI